MPLRRFSAQFILLTLFATSLYAQNTASWRDPSPHSTRFVSVDKGIQLEVLDWGGSGRAVVLLAGGGNTAHIFDDFAPRLTAFGHVYGITRRGFGASGFADVQADTDRLGADVLAVIDALKLDRPVLVGHSFAGAELSAVANLRPDRIAGVVYMDAAYSYAFDDGNGSNVMEMQQVQAPQPPGPSEAEEASFSALQKYYERMNGFRFPEAELRQERESAPTGGVGKFRDPPGGAMLMSIIKGGKKYRAIPAPALILFANPHGLGTWVDQSTDAKVRNAAKSFSTEMNPLVEKQENAVRNGVPAAHLLTLAGANHYIFLSNEDDVVRDIRDFVAHVP